MTKEEIFAIIDDELEKRKYNTFLLWDFPNDVKKRIEELYQSIDNANPSEAMEKLDKVNNYLNDVYDYKEIKEEVRKDIETIKQALLKSQEQEKENAELKQVLSIIKEKDVNIWYLTVSTKVKNYKDYNSFLMNDKNKRQLTQEEFELLKRWVK